MKKFITGLCMAAALALPVASLAQPADGPDADGTPHCREQGRDQGHGQHGHRGKHDRHGFRKADGKPFFLRGINLTAEQDSKIQALLRDQQPALETRFAAADKARTDLRQLAASGNFDEKQAQRLAQAIATADADAALQRARLHAQVVQELTPEQRQQLQQRQLEREQRHPLNKPEKAAGPTAS